MTTGWTLLRRRWLFRSSSVSGAAAYTYMFTEQYRLADGLEEVFHPLFHPGRINKRLCSWKNEFPRDLSRENYEQWSNKTPKEIGNMFRQEVVWKWEMATLWRTWVREKRMRQMTTPDKNGRGPGDYQAQHRIRQAYDSRKRDLSGEW